MIMGEIFMSLEGLPMGSPGAAGAGASGSGGVVTGSGSVQGPVQSPFGPTPPQPTIITPTAVGRSPFAHVAANGEVVEPNLPPLMPQLPRGSQQEQAVQAAQAAKAAPLRRAGTPGPSQAAQRVHVPHTKNNCSFAPGGEHLLPARLPQGGGNLSLQTWSAPEDGVNFSVRTPHPRDNYDTQSTVENLDV